MPAGESSRDSAGDAVALRDVAEAAGLITVPAAGLATLALYFGWRRTQSYAQYFGIDNSVLGYSIQEYVLRSAGSVYRIVQVTVIVGLLALVTHRMLLRIRGTPGGRVAAGIIAAVGLYGLLIWAASPLSGLLGGSPAWTSIAAVAIAAVPVVIVVVDRLRGRRDGMSRLNEARAARYALLAAGAAGLDALAVPARGAVLRAPYVAVDTLLAFGAVLVGYAYLISRPPSSRRDPLWMRTLLVVFAALLILVGTFAATDEYAQAVGTREARLTAARLADRRGVIVFSAKNLDLPPVVHCERLRAPDLAYQFRCDGLRLFTRTEKGTLVLPQSWSRADGRTPDDSIIVIPDDPSIRLEFTPGAGDIPPDPL